MSNIRYKIRITKGPLAGQFAKNPSGEPLVYDDAFLLITGLHFSSAIVADDEGWEIVRVRVVKKPSKTKRALDLAMHGLAMLKESGFQSAADYLDSVNDILVGRR